MPKQLWLDAFILLDQASGSQANAWRSPPELYLPFGNAVRAAFTIEYALVGPVLHSDLEIHLERSAGIIDSDDAFEDMANVPIALAMRQDTVSKVFGQDGHSVDLYPRGLGRVRIENTHATESAAVRVRIWAVLQCYAGRAGADEQEWLQRGRRGRPALQMREYTAPESIRKVLREGR